MKPLAVKTAFTGTPPAQRARASLRSLLLAATLLSAGAASAQLTANDPARGVGKVDFVQKLNSQIPLDLEFRDSNGLAVRLGDFFGDKPVILLPVYYECPSMCTFALNGALDVFNDIAAHDRPFIAGRDFNVVTFSFNHKETHVLAEQKKTAYLAQYPHEGGPEGWRFLVGDEANIKALAEAIGFSFEWVPAIEEFAHRSGLVLATRDGVVSRYFPGIAYEPRDVRFGLIEASEGRIGGVVERLFLLCYHYDPAAGSYGLVISRVVNFACLLTALVLGAVLFTLFRRERVSRLAHA